MSEIHTTGTSTSIWVNHWSSAVGELKSSAIRELLKVTEQPGVISFAGGLPAPESFPAEEIALATERVLATQTSRVLQYGPTEGFPPLRQFITTVMRSRGTPITSEQVLITSGSQQALDIIGKLLIDPGDPVLVESPTYIGALQAWRPYRPRFVSVPTDHDGLQVDALERTIVELSREGQPPKFLYVISTFQNPTGVTMSVERRRALIDLASRYGLPIVEDDPYSALRYSGTPIPPLIALDVERWGTPRHVVYLSTFSKLLAPSLRVGWIVGADELLRRVVQVKQGIDLHTGTLVQAIVYEACRDGLLERHIPRIRQIYHTRRDIMLRELERLMPTDLHWTRPDGGMFLWVTLPQEIDAAVLLEQALAHNVAFVPGEAFFANGGGQNTLRLNFSHSSPEQICEGVARLSNVFASL